MPLILKLESFGNMHVLDRKEGLLNRGFYINLCRFFKQNIYLNSEVPEVCIFQRFKLLFGPKH